MNTATSYNYEWILVQKIWILSDLSLQAFCSFTANWRWSNLTKRGCTSICSLYLPSASKRKYIWNTPYIHTDDITHLNCVSLSCWLLWKLKPYNFLRTKSENVNQVRRGKSYSKHQHRFVCYYFLEVYRQSFFGGRQRVLLGKPRFNKRGCFPSILSCRYTFPGPGDSALPFGTGENPLWFGIQSHLLCGFFQQCLLVQGIRRKARKKQETVDELDPRILNHLEMYQTPQSHSDITSNSPRKMKQRSWRELKCCEISGYLDAQWSKSWLGGKRSSKWKKPCWRSIWVICRFLQFDQVV